MLLAEDEADGRQRQVDSAVNQPVMSDAADAGGGDAGHHCYSSSSHDNYSAMSWTSAEVMSWLERSQLQHLTDWYV